MLANNIFSGLEPIFAASSRRRIRNWPGGIDIFDVEDYACRVFREQHGEALPPFFVRATDVAPEGHLAMQAVLQADVDGAIAKTVNVSADYPIRVFDGRLYETAYAKGLKAYTAFGLTLLPAKFCWGRKVRTKNAVPSPVPRISAIPELLEIHSRYVFSPLRESGKLAGFNPAHSLGRKRRLHEPADG